MKVLIGILTLVVLSACGHHRDVRPSSDGVHSVVVAADNETDGPRDAIAQANHFCDDRYKRVAAIEKEETKYTGSMDEDNYRMAKTASDVLKQGGTQAWVFGGKTEKQAGEVAAGTGSVIDNSLGKAYTTKMTFKCI